MSTLLGLDDRAGELPGWGPIPATAARCTVARQRRAQWRWGVVDTDGHLLAEGLTRHRPGHLSRTDPAGGIVEIHVPEALLATMAATPTGYGDWAGVIADIAARYQQYRSQDDPGAALDARPGARFPARRCAVTPRFVIARVSILDAAPRLDSATKTTLWITVGAGRPLGMIWPHYVDTIT